MNSAFPVGTNRLNGLDVIGDEPSLIGIATRALTFEKVDPIELESVVHNASLLPEDPIRVALCELFDEWEEGLRRGQQRHLLRLETNHISRDSGGLYDLNEFEKALQAELDQIAWICLRPLQDLRYEELVQPIGRVRRPARGAAQQLSAHSEQWDRWAPDFPIPKEILASIRDDDTDLFENRVTRTLVNGALLHLNRRLQQLRSHLTKNVQGRDVLLSGWHWRQERLRVAFDSHDVDIVIEMLERAVAELEIMADRLVGLEKSPLFKGTAARSRVRTLRMTNVLRRDPRYRRIPPLWRLWSSVQDEDVAQRKRLDDPTLSQRGMDVLVEVLTAKALDWLGFSFDSASETYRRGMTSITLTFEDGVALIGISDLVGSRSVRIVGLATPLRSAHQPDALHAARLLDGWLGTHCDSISDLAILHPVDVNDVRDVKQSERILIDHTGLDAVDATRKWSLIPASPLLVDSLERVTRFLRWHLTAPVYLFNVIRVPCGEINRTDRAAFDALTSCRIDGRELLLDSPLSSSDRQVLVGMQKRRPADWLSQIGGVDALYHDLLRCPIYPTHQATFTQFERRDDGTFNCSCKSCRSEWGSNICKTCGTAIPYIKPGKAVPDGELPSDFFGGDLLSSLCEGARASDVESVGGGPDLRVPICPTCRVCPRSSRFTDCGRCSSRADSTV